MELLPRSRLEEARAVLARACAFDAAATVAEEKLFGPAPQPSTTLMATHRDLIDGLAVVSGRWLRLLAVDPPARRRGVGQALLAAAEAAGARRVGDQPGNYLAPGVDERDRETIGFFTNRGYRPVSKNENLAVSYAPRTPRVPDGYTLRRARPQDAAALAALAGGFSNAWAFEAALALAGDPPSVHIALAGDEVVAFACIDANNRGLHWFGPTGTMPAHRGRGLGEALLCACLADVAADAIIAWAAPAARGFYERACGARPDRTFVVLEKS